MQQKRQAQQFNCPTRRFIFIRYPPALRPRPALHCGHTPGRGTAAPSQRHMVQGKVSAVLPVKQVNGGDSFCFSVYPNNCRFELLHRAPCAGSHAFRKTGRGFAGVLPYSCLHVQMFLLYCANVKSKIWDLSRTCKIASSHRFYRDLIAAALKLSYNYKYFLFTRESRNKSHDV